MVQPGLVRTALRRRLVVHGAARLRPAGPAALRRGRAPRRALPGARAPWRYCGARADARLLRDRRPRGRTSSGWTRGSPRAAAMPRTGRTSRGTQPCTSWPSTTPEPSSAATSVSSRRRRSSGPGLWSTRPLFSGDVRSGRRRPDARVNRCWPWPVPICASHGRLSQRSTRRWPGRRRAPSTSYNELGLLARSKADPTMREVIAPLTTGLASYVSGRYSTAADQLLALLPRLLPVVGATSRGRSSRTPPSRPSSGRALRRGSTLLDCPMDRRRRPRDATLRARADIRSTYGPAALRDPRAAGRAPVGAIFSQRPKSRGSCHPSGWARRVARCGRRAARGRDGGWVEPCGIRCTLRSGGGSVSHA